MAYGHRSPVRNVIYRFRKARLAALVAAGSMLFAVSPASAQTWYGEFTALHMARNAPNPVPFVSSGAEGTGNLLHSNDMQFGWTAGFEAHLGVASPGGQVGLEVRGFTLSPFFAAVGPVAFGGGAWLETTPTQSLQTDVWLFTLENTTTFRGFDASVVINPLGPFSVYAGVAHMGLHDNLVIDLLGTGELHGIATFDTHNTLTGLQIGARARIGGNSPGSLFLAADGRVGWLFNNVVVDTDYHDVGPDVHESDTATTQTQAWMFVGGVSVGARLSDGLSFSVGYYATLLENVVMATDQVPQTANTSGGFEVLGFTFTDFVTHGVRFSLTLSF